MNEGIILPAGLSLGIIAFLLALLPAGFFIWLWYLRRHTRSIPAQSIALAFFGGLVIVIPAFWLEDMANSLWLLISPSTAHNFAGATLPLMRLSDILLPALGTFLVVAVIEEGLRYFVMRLWIQRSKVIDQVFDGLLIGVAVGLGFATLENTIYFWQLFQEGSFDTLVFVFFLRFIISTLAHISFSVLMGALLARGMCDLFNRKVFLISAFLLPWALHGLYDLLLGINQGMYAVLMLLPPLLVLVFWTRRRDFFVVHRKNGRFLASAQPPQTKAVRAVQKVLKTMDSPWNVNAPWLSKSKAYISVLRSVDTYDS